MRDLKQLIKAMTLEEKAGMCSGADFWHLKGVERLGIPSIMVCDGPHGLRKQDQSADHLGIHDSIKAVCFPTACATACSFDRALLEEMGTTLGEECQAENIGVILGPAVNMKRSPLCGRNFEYFSEDPYLTGELAAAQIKGVESQGVSTSIKHFAANNQEYRRMTCSSEVDERTLREIYLPCFETAIKEAKPGIVMCSYNKINGEFASENHRLLTEVLREEWGFNGYVMSDWGAVNDRVKGLKAGLELEMPSSNGNTDKEIVEAVKNGELDETILDTAVERILNIVFKFADNRKQATFDLDKDHEKAVKMAKESMVLLKNNGVLPLPKEGKKIAFIGEFAKKPRFQGGGSSHINAFKVVSALDAAKNYTTVTYAPGYDAKGRQLSEAEEKAYLEEAVKVAQTSDIVVIFAGLPDAYECEGYDREHLALPKEQDRLIEAIAKIHENVVVVLHNGSPIEMPWADDVEAILESYLCGQGVGEAQCALLFGASNPCGKLAETFPYQLSHNPSYLNFPGDGDKVYYREGVFVGYRYYEKKEIPVRFAFGHGLSYTTFEYSDLTLSSQEIKDTDEVVVSLKVKNTGTMAGKEVVQLYVADKTQMAMRPVKELKQFEKIDLLPGEEKTVTMTLNKRSFAWYNEKINDWYVNTGTYCIMVGSSSQDIRLEQNILVHSTYSTTFKVDRNTTVAELMRRAHVHPMLAETIKQLQEKILGTDEKEESSVANEAITEEMNIKMMENSPLRTLRSFNGVSNEELDQLIETLNQILNNA